MNKQKTSQRPLAGNYERSTVTEESYYVQRLTEQVFVIREHVSGDGEPRPADRIVKSFDMSHDAYVYVDMLNEKQRKLDAEKRAE